MKVTEISTQMVTLMNVCGICYTRSNKETASVNLKKITSLGSLREMACPGMIWLTGQTFMNLLDRKFMAFPITNFVTSKWAY